MSLVGYLAYTSCFRCSFSRSNFMKRLSCLRITTKYSPCVAKFATKSKDSESDLDNNEPLQFTTTKAFTWSAKKSRAGGMDDDTPWYQPLVISASLAVFMLYFFVYREESDVDEQFSKSLYDRIEGLEKHQLNVNLEYNKQRGIDSGPILQRLKEIEEEEALKAKSVVDKELLVE